MRWSQTVIDWADGDPAKGNLVVGSPLAVALVWRGTARFWLGLNGWRQDLDDAVAMARNTDPLTHTLVVFWTHGLRRLPTGCSSPMTPRCASSTRRCRSPNDRATIPRLALRVRVGYRAGNREDPADHQRGLELLAQVRDMCMHERFYRSDYRPRASRRVAEGPVW